MNTRTVWAVVIIIIVGGGLWWLLGRGATPTPLTGETAGTAAMSSSSADTSGAEMASQDPAMVGTWKSTDDANFTRTFTADGHVTDAYKGQPDATETGTYVVVDPAKEDVGVPVDTVLGMTVLKLSFPKSGVMYFGVQKETESSLQLIYLGRGNILSFTKISAQ